MKTLVFGVAAVVAATATLAFARQERKPAPTQPQATKQHELLKRFEGEWSIEGRCWQKPDQPEKISGSSSAKLALNGLWLIVDETSELDGKTVSSHGLLGYDLEKGKYVGAWISTMTTGMCKISGSADASGRTFTFDVDTYDPIAMRRVMEKLVIQIKNEDTHTATFSREVGGRVMKTAEITYTRK